MSGSDIPDAVASFDELYERYSIPPFLKRNIATAGYLQPTPIQMQAIPLMLHVSVELQCIYNVHVVYTTSHVLYSVYMYIVYCTL